MADDKTTSTIENFRALAAKAADVEASEKAELAELRHSDRAGLNLRTKRQKEDHKKYVLGGMLVHLPAPVQPIQQPRTIDDLSREELDSICNKLVAKEMQVRADAAGILIGQFKALPLEDQIQLGRGAGLPREEAQRLADIKERLRKLPMVAPPVSIAEPARQTVPSPTPPEPVPKPPIEDEFEGMTQRQIDDLRSRSGFGRG